MMTTDFDFLLGSWKIQNRYLKKRLRGSTDWLEFTAKSDVRPLLNGLGNVDRFAAIREGQPIEGMHLRLLNPSTREWSLYWADTIKPGFLQPPLIGRFQNDCGVFFGEDEVDGCKVLSRYRWESCRADNPGWEQAFSSDNGLTWETNWVMRFTRIARLSEKDSYLNLSEQDLDPRFESLVTSEERSPRRAAFKSGTKTIVLQLEHLEWLEAQKDYVLLHVGRETHLIRATMTRMAAELDPRFFCRIHRSAIVNIDHMKEIKTGAAGESTVVMRDGTALPLSRGYREPLFAVLDVKPISHSA